MDVDEKRNASRFAVPPEIEQAELYLDGHDFAARLTDQSAGGFGVQLDTSVGIQPEQAAALSWSGGCCRVRVVSRTDEQNFTRLGLARLEELESPRDIEPTTSLWSLRRQRLPLPQGNLSYCVSGLMVIIGFAIGGVVWEYVPTHVTSGLQSNASGPQKVDEATSPAVPVPARAPKLVDDTAAPAVIGPRYEYGVSASKVLPRPVRQWIAGRQQALHDAATGIVQALPEVPTMAAKQAVLDAVSATTDAANRVVSLTDQSTLVALSQYMHLLHVTDAQQKEIDAILNSSRQATQDVQKRSRELGTVQAMGEIERIRRAAGDQAVAVLSAEQLEQLRKLMSSTHQNAKEVAKSAPPAATD